MKCIRVVAFTICLLLGLVAGASAQDEPAPIKNRFALGADFKIKTSDRSSQEDYARGQFGPGDTSWNF